MRVEILVEEPSMKVFLESIFDKLADTDVWAINKNVFIREFDGKSDLMKNIGRKAKVYANFHEPVYMFVIHDQDGNNCEKLKKDIISRIEYSDRLLLEYKVRIVCKELECWYFGDSNALLRTFPDINKTELLKRLKHKNPEVLNGKDELKKILKSYSAIDAAKKIASYMDVNHNKCKSFHTTLDALREVLV